MVDNSRVFVTACQAVAVGGECEGERLADVTFDTGVLLTGFCIPDTNPSIKEILPGRTKNTQGDVTCPQFLYQGL